MSDYDDDYSDYGEDWFYVEDEYMAADDLAEHAVASPPPTTYGDEDMLPDWDRFDYFNDLEYASDGYDNAKFEVHNAKDAKTGQKRKRAMTKTRSSKRRPPATADGLTHVPLPDHSPIVWRAQTDRETKPKLLDENAQPYALLKHWREELAETPPWARGSPPKSRGTRSPRPGKAKGKGKMAVAPPVLSPSDIGADQLEDVEGDVEEDAEEEEDVGISQEALMAALQRQLAAAGGPFSSMDPQQLLEFAMRMATNKDAGDDIAGEMADAMLGGDDDDDDEDGADMEENLLSWVAQQRNANEKASKQNPHSQDVPSTTKRPPTPPSSSSATRSVRAPDTTTATATATTTTTVTLEKSPTKTPSLKRKADADADADADANIDESTTTTTTTTTAPKKRTTRSFEAPTPASQARAGPRLSRRGNARANRT